MTDKSSNKLRIIHIAAECYPAAKVGGLGDVVGALPKYLQKSDVDVHVVMPKYGTPWFKEHSFEEVFVGEFWNPQEHIHYTVYKLEDPSFGFHLYAIHIPGKFDRNGVYSDQFGYFGDETERWLAFQRAALGWISRWASMPDLIHSHDHHCGLISFMMRSCDSYATLRHIPSVFTIHNEAYQGIFGWSRQFLLPSFDPWKSGLLDWDNRINPLACGVKCADRVTTVSPSFMQELQIQAYGLEGLFVQEKHKSVGILNGIDNELWNPKKDSRIATLLKRSETKFKRENKGVLCELAGLDPKLPLLGFIGRMVHQKGADILARSLFQLLRAGHQFSCSILGTGDKNTENSFHQLSMMFPRNIAVSLNYDESLAHQIYAGSDFLLMPSRTEPCGLNQMYAMRYGSIPVVHHIGGLKDSVIDYKEPNGTGIKFYELHDYSVSEAILKACDVYQNKDLLTRLMKSAMAQDFSWEQSAITYKNLYEELI